MQRLAGVSSVIYLTSDAGEGKTTLINHIARFQAESYKKKETDWLLVPVTLGGRPFMRLDDVVVGELANRLKFLFLYYQAFLELVRMGVIVLALDGFEEMFVETSSGDATSALGNLHECPLKAGSRRNPMRRLADSTGGMSCEEMQDRAFGPHDQREKEIGRGAGSGDLRGGAAR
jgi:hypothetical protein